MLQKLRSRHDIDLPYEGFGRRRPTLAILGLIAVAFLFVPLLLALVSGFWRDGSVHVSTAQGIAAGVGALLLVIIVATLVGKTGHDR